MKHEYFGNSSEIVKVYKVYCVGCARSHWADCLPPRRCYLPCFGVEVRLEFTKFIRCLSKYATSRGGVNRQQTSI